MVWLSGPAYSFAERRPAAAMATVTSAAHQSKATCRAGSEPEVSRPSGHCSSQGRPEFESGTLPPYCFFCFPFSAVIVPST
jgi:hypothetical protein